MKIDVSKGIASIFLLLIMLGYINSAEGILQSSNSVSSTGSISYSHWPQVGVNNLALGVQLDMADFALFVNSAVKRQLATDAKLTLIRCFNFRKPSDYPNLMACTHWSDDPALQTWNWANVDQLTQNIFSIGAEPLWCFGWARSNTQNYIPSGMAINPSTGLPYPNSYAAYCKAWVTHFKTLGWPVRYYEIFNEADVYFGWNPTDTTKLSYFNQVWTATANAMRTENPDVKVSFDRVTMKNVLNYWIQYGGELDFLDFHKYDAYKVGQYSDADMLNRAEQYQFETSSTWYGIDDARQRWFNARGKWLPVINSESNFNSAYSPSTDPKILQMVGAVWNALVLRKEMLLGLNYHVYYALCGGFGLISSDNQIYYPYHVLKMVGSNLAVGDKIVEVNISPSSNDIRSIAWIHQGTLNILLINKVTGSRTVTLGGVNGPLSVSWIDNAKPTMQTGQISSPTLTMNGYTVTLLQTLAPS